MAFNYARLAETRLVSGVSVHLMQGSGISYTDCQSTTPTITSALGFTDSFYVGQRFYISKLVNHWQIFRGFHIFRTNMLTDVTINSVKLRLYIKNDLSDTNFNINLYKKAVGDEGWADTYDEAITEDTAYDIWNAGMTLHGSVSTNTGIQTDAELEKSYVEYTLSSSDLLLDSDRFLQIMLSSSREGTDPKLDGLSTYNEFIEFYGTGASNSSLQPRIIINISPSALGIPFITEVTPITIYNTETVDMSISGLNLSGLTVINKITNVYFGSESSTSSPHLKSGNIRTRDVGTIGTDVEVEDALTVTVPRHLYISNPIIRADKAALNGVIFRGGFSCSTKSEDYYTTMKTLLDNMKARFLLYHNNSDGTPSPDLTRSYLKTIKKGSFLSQPVFPALALVPQKESIVDTRGTEGDIVERLVSIQIYTLNVDTKKSKDDCLNLIEKIKNICKFNYSWPDGDGENPSCFDTRLGEEVLGDPILFGNKWVQKGSIQLTCYSKEAREVATKPSGYVIGSAHEMEEELATVLEGNRQSGESLSSIRTLSRAELPMIPRFPAIVVSSEAESINQEREKGRYSPMRRFFIDIYTKQLDREDSINECLTLTDSVKSILEINRHLNGRAIDSDMDSIIFGQSGSIANFPLYLSRIVFDTWSYEEVDEF